MNVTFTAKCVVLTTGTFMNGLMHIGRTKLRGGRISERLRTESPSNWSNWALRPAV